MKKKIAGIVLGCACGLFLLGGVAFLPADAEKLPSGEVFVSEEIKYKVGQTDGVDEGKEGLLLYGYTGGASADFKTFEGVFETEMKPLSSDLKTTSLVFSDNKTGKSFSVKIRKNGDVTDVSVCVDGEEAGIHYFADTQKTSCYARGYTAGYNQKEQYTRIYGDSSVKLAFDPAAMTVSLQFKSDNQKAGAMLTVWDFTNEYNDGKRLSHDLPKFGEYNVSVVFDSVKSSGKGELLVYSLGNYDFSERFFDISDVSVEADFKAKAIVGKAYELPLPVLQSPIGEVEGDGAFVVDVYDSDGKKIRENCGETITFETNGVYYFHYSYDNGKAEGYYRVETLEQAAVEQRFIYESDIKETMLGVNSVLYIPACEMQSNLSANGANVDVAVTMRRNGIVVEDCDGVTGGFEYIFTETGSYEIEYSSNDFGVEKTEKVTIIVSDDIPNVVVPEFAATVDVNAEVEIPVLKVYVGGKEIDGKATVTFPSFKQTSQSTVVADEVGVYTVTYSYEYLGTTYEEERSFIAAQRTDALFTGTDATVAYGQSTVNNQIGGATVTFKNYGVVTYGNVIDLSDNTKDDILIELMAQPAVCGVSDMSAIVITFTDVYDSTNKMMIRLREQGNTTKIRAQGKNQNYAGYNYNAEKVEAEMAHEVGGFGACHDFTQSGRQYYEMPNGTMKLYYDAEENALYGMADLVWSESPLEVKKRKIIDFDDPEHFSRAWSGFTTGEVYVSLTAYGISNTADVMICNIDGVSLAQGSVLDTDAPTIVVKNEAELPLALVNKEYRVPEFYAVDALSQIVSSSYKVTFGNKEISVENGRFVPTTAGNYKITYTVADGFGNVGEKTITITAKTKLDSLDLKISANLPDTVEIGSTISVPDATASGGAGRLQISCAAFYDEKEAEIAYGTLLCDKIGEYTLVYTVTDYLGQIYKVEKSITVTAATKPIFDENSIVLPSAFRNGTEYVFARYEAKVYRADGSVGTVSAKIVVTDGAGEQTLGADGKYQPTSSETVNSATVRFVFEADGMETLEIVKSVAIQTVKEATGYLKDYFATKNLEVSSDANGLHFGVKKIGEASLEFINPVSMRSFQLRFGITADNVKFKSMRIVLRDMYDANAVVRLVVAKNGNGLTCSVNDGDALFMSGSWTQDGSFTIAYNQDSMELSDEKGVVITQLQTYANGMAFNGFPSGRAYFSVSFEKSDLSGANASFSLLQINNQALSYVKNDRIEPELYINGKNSGRYYVGTEIVIPAAEAYDVLNPLKKLTMTLKAPDDTVLFNQVDATKEYTFTLEQIGKYEITYEAVDKANRSTSVTRSVICCDGVAPTLQLKTPLPEKTSVGAKLTLPNYIVTDDNPTAVQVTVNVIAPNGVLAAAQNGEIVFETKGNYIVQYVVRDENGNVNVYVYKIKAE